MKFLIFIRANALVPSQTYDSVDFYFVVSMQAFLIDWVLCIINMHCLFRVFVKTQGRTEHSKLPL